VIDGVDGDSQLGQFRVRHVAMLLAPGGHRIPIRSPELARASGHDLQLPERAVA
jgi:hypothetical protein